MNQQSKPRPSRGFATLLQQARANRFGIVNLLLTVTMLLVLPASKLSAANIAPEGSAIMGVNDAIDGDAGTPRFNAGVAAHINDNDPTTRVDNWFGAPPTDLGQNHSFVGILWPSKRYDPIIALSLTLATFTDGGWFGTSGIGPGPGGTLTSAHLIAPVIQVTSDGGLTWTTISSDSDYGILEGHTIGGGGNPNPTSVTAPFFVLEHLTRIDGIRVIGENGGNAGADANGFIGVFELVVESMAFTDSDGDGLPDEWEEDHGLIVGVNDAGEDPDSDGLTNLGEYLAGTNPNLADTDGDGLSDGDEVLIHMTNPLRADTDGDGLSDGDEVNVHMTDPLLADTDGDGLSDGDEVNIHGTSPLLQDTDGDGFLDPFELAQGTDPTDPNSYPNNFALTGTGLLGTRNPGTGVELDYYHAGTAGNINDGNNTTRVDTWNGNQPATLPHTESYVGILWEELVTDPILRLELTLATFVDGGWFGVNSSGPGAGGALTASHLSEPRIEISTDGGSTWSTVPHTSDYLTSLLGHRIGGGGQPNPTAASATFVLDEPVTGVNGIRIIGSEGGTASGGFLGVFELGVRGQVSDADGDGMDDDWERLNGLIVGVNDAGEDADGDGLTNLEEFLRGTNPQLSDTDGDGLTDGAEVHEHGTDPLRSDTDGDGLSDGDEVNIHGTNPLLADSDGDGFSDWIELLERSDPNDPESVPNNFAYSGTGILGVRATISGGAETLVFNAGTREAINDGNPNTRVDSFRNTGETASFVGILWDEPITEPIYSVQFIICTFFDGGWFGPNNSGPGAGGVLSAAYLSEPNVEVTTDGGVTWTVVGHTSDYLAVMDGHPLPAVAFGAPTAATATFRLNDPQTGLNGIRLVGSEGGTASGGFLGVWEFAVRGFSADSDNDGMDDSWEELHGLIVGIDDSAEDPDADGLTNLQEFERGTNPQLADTDGDGLNDGDEVLVHMTNPLVADTDGDGLTDGEEVNTYGTNPLLADTDGDGISDGAELALGSDPLNPLSYPINVARSGTGLLGTKPTLDSGTETPRFNSGTAANIVDGNLSSRVDNWNGNIASASDTVSFVGVQWAAPIHEPVFALRLRLATFGDGGWFGVNNLGPGAGQPLTASHLAEPRIEITTDGGATWTVIAHTSDYLSAAEGHRIGGGGQPNPTAFSALFELGTPPAGINGIRIIGTEGGTASGGFLGVFELEAFVLATDEDNDGMEDSWERRHGLNVGVDDSAGDPDGDGLTNIEEFEAGTNPQVADTDGDGLNDGDEVKIHNTNPLVADTDGDGLSDGEEITLGTNPLVADTDGDGFSDGYEVAHGSDPTNAGSIPPNLAILGTAILGTKAALDSGLETPRFNAGITANINDGNPNTRVDNWNGNIASATDPLSFVGIIWAAPVLKPIENLVLTMATFGDGGWFGVNNAGPGAGQPLTPSHLAEPIVEITTDGGATWTSVGHTSDYLAVFEGHLIGGGGQPNPTKATATFTLDTPAEGINGIRIIGTEGGTASGGFIGVFELETNSAVEQRLSLNNITRIGDQFRFEFDSANGITYEVQYKTSLNDPEWQLLQTIAGDGTSKQVTDTIGAGMRIYRVVAP
jgi:hypothetical protein